ncbi:MAG: SDR family NAD(P)-dependent oxidoreductase [Bacteroidota bacterium]
MNILITGGHSGMGLELSKKLLAKGHTVGLIIRSESRKQEVEKLFADDNLPIVFIADLSKRDQIDAVAQEITKQWNKIDGLFNNAGVLLDKLYFSDYGNELQLEINAISPYLLVKALKHLLDNAEAPFVVSTATSGLERKTSIDIENFKRPKKFTKLLGSYLDSKLMLVLLMNYQSEQWENVRFVSIDPGAIKTKMTAGDGMPFWLKPIRNLFFKSPKHGAENLYQGAFGSKNSGSGIYVSGGKIKKMKISISTQEVEVLME